MKTSAVLAVAGLVATVVVATAPAGSAAPAAPRLAGSGSQTSAPVAPVSWGRCADSTLRQLGGRCGYVRVPLDYSRPGGATIRLAVSRIRHTVAASKYQGVMLVNPGGPGGSGLTLSTLGPIISDGFGRKDAGGAYDWIGFDPRGVGASRPSISCDPKVFAGDRPEYVPSTPELLSVWRARSKAYAKACGKKAGRLLPHMRTTDSARDLDMIRRALGASKINYYGYSYGTYLGQVYTKLFPKRMRRMVLDSNVDPRKVWYAANLDQDVAFDRNINLFFDWVAKYATTYGLGTTRAKVAARFDASRAALAATPFTGVVGPDEWDDIFIHAGYAQFLWPDLATTFANYSVRGDGASALTAYRDYDTPGDDNSYAGYLAVSCVDDTWKDENFLGDQLAMYARAPFLTWSNGWFNAPCFYWPAKGKPRTKITGKGVGSVLLVGETLDAATPFSGSLYLRSIFPKARLVSTVGGTSHAISPSGNSCVDRRIFDYLATGALPDRRQGGRADVRCAPLPQPKPSPGAGFTPSVGTSSRIELARAVRQGDADSGRALLARLLTNAAASRP